MAELFHHHHPRRDDDGDTPAAWSEPGSKSLADALRVSFRLLSVLMLIVLVFYMLTGVKSVESSQVGVLKRFGRVVKVVEPGLAYTWPFPIGDIDLVSTAEQELTISDFWMSETPEQKAAGDLLSRQVFTSALDPARDGALLTGDRNLLHVRLSCKYRVDDPVKYLSHIGDEPDRVRETVRSALCHSAIRAAAVQTADGLQRTERAAFTAEVRRQTQQELDALDSGLEVLSVLMTDSTWPLGALRAYVQAQNAVSKAEQLRNAARAEAEKILNDAAGGGYRRLVGDIEGLMPAAETQTPAGEPQTPGAEDLLGQYAAAVDAGQTAQAEQLLARIDEVLRSNETGGEAARIIAEAEAYRTATIQGVKGRVERFRELLPAYEKTPELLLDRLWMEVREAVLEAPTNEKFYLTFGPGRMVLRLNRDPKIAAEIERALKAKERQE